MKTIEKIKNISKEVYDTLLKDGYVNLFYDTGHSFGHGEWDYYSITIYLNRETQEVEISGKKYNSFSECPQQFDDENSIFEAIDKL